MDFVRQMPIIPYQLYFILYHNGEVVGHISNLSASLINQQLLQLNKDFANGANVHMLLLQQRGCNLYLLQKDQFAWHTN
jgi:hypothetical protein